MAKTVTKYAALHGARVPYSLVRRARQKHIRLRITREGSLTVSAPLSASAERIAEVLQTKGTWILKHLEAAKQRLEDHDPLETVLFLGERFDVIRKRDERFVRGSVRADPRRRNVTVRAPHPSADEVRRLLAMWLRREAKKRLSQRLEELARHMSVATCRLYLRNQRTRWGSSSSLGTISINWRIIMAPAEVQDYLLIHELCHQKHRNHTQRFWREVEHWCPDYRAHDGWLRDHAVLLALFR